LKFDRYTLWAEGLEVVLDADMHISQTSLKRCIASLHFLIALANFNSSSPQPSTSSSASSDSSSFVLDVLPSHALLLICANRLCRCFVFLIAHSAVRYIYDSVLPTGFLSHINEQLQLLCSSRAKILSEKNKAEVINENEEEIGEKNGFMEIKEDIADEESSSSHLNEGKVDVRVVNNSSGYEDSNEIHFWHNDEVVLDGFAQHENDEDVNILLLIASLQEARALRMYVHLIDVHNALKKIGSSLSGYEIRRPIALNYGSMPESLSSRLLSTQASRTLRMERGVKLTELEEEQLQLCRALVEYINTDAVVLGESSLPLTERLNRLFKFTREGYIDFLINSSFFTSVNLPLISHDSCAGVIVTSIFPFHDHFRDRYHLINDIRILVVPLLINLLNSYSWALKSSSSIGIKLCDIPNVKDLNISDSDEFSLIRILSEEESQKVSKWLEDWREELLKCSNT
jgi:hypothetical protein